MDELKPIIAGNIIRLRLSAGMTQAELGEKLNYSDKTISKWERAESMPDAAVLKKLSELFDVSVDSLLCEANWIPEPQAAEELKSSYSRKAVTYVAITGIWTLAALLFVIFWLLGHIIWLFFVYAVPLSLVALLVLNSVWNQGKENRLIVGGLVLSVFVATYLSLLKYHPWQLFLLLIPAELLVYFSFRIRNRH